TRFSRDWSSDVCSSDLAQAVDPTATTPPHAGLNRTTKFVYSGDNASASGGKTTITDPKGNVTVEQYQYGERQSVTKAPGTAYAEIGRASCRERGETQGG